MRYLPLLTVLVLLVSGCATPKNTTDVPPKPDKPIVAGNVRSEIVGTSAYLLGEEVKRGAVSVYPVKMAATGPDPDPAQDVATLTEALSNGWITVTEVGGGTVDTLLVHNSGPKPVLMLAGELLQGGKQDRVVVKDTLIPPGTTVAVPVNCVEKGRWTPGRESFKPLSYQAPASIREKAMYGNQEAVWGRVSEYNAKVGYAGAETSVNRGLEQTRTSNDFLAHSRLLAELSLEDKHTVGAVILVNGKIVSFELFGSHSLIKGSLPGILAGAFAEPISASQTPGAATREEVAAFVADILAGKRLNKGAANGARHADLSASAVEGKEIGGDQYNAAASPATGVDGVLHGSYRQKK